MAHECTCKVRCEKSKALETAVDQYHKWDDMVFKEKDGVPPLVNVQLTAYTMDFFLRETQLLKLLFANNPSHPEDTNTNMATVLYDRNKLVGIAIEYGNDERAYIAMEQLDAGQFRDLHGWREHPEEHAFKMRQRIRDVAGKDIGLIKCADLEGFFGRLGKVVDNPNTLEMLLEGVKFACGAVSAGHLSIQPEPKFFDYLRMLDRLTKRRDMKAAAECISSHLPDFAAGLVLQNRKMEFAAVEIYARESKLQFQDFGDLGLLTGIPLKEVASFLREQTKQTFAVGLTTDFLYNVLYAALTHSPYKLGKAVFSAVRKGELVVC